MTGKLTDWAHIPFKIQTYLLHKQDFTEYEKHYRRAWPQEIRGNIVNFHWELTRQINSLPLGKTPNYQVNFDNFATNIRALDTIAKLSKEVITAKTDLKPNFNPQRTIDLYVDVPIKRIFSRSYLFYGLKFSLRLRLYYDDRGCHSVRIMPVPFSELRGNQARQWNLANYKYYNLAVDKLLQQQGFRSEIIYQQRGDREANSEQISYFWSVVTKRLMQSGAILLGAIYKYRRYWQVIPWGMEQDNPFATEKLFSEEPLVISMVDAWAMFVNDLCYIYGNSSHSLAEVVKYISPQRDFETMTAYVRQLKWQSQKILLQQEMETSYHQDAIKKVSHINKLVEDYLRQQKVDFTLAAKRKFRYIKSD